MFRALHIVEELGGGGLRGGTRIGQALIVINVLFQLQRTQKSESVEKKMYPLTYGGHLKLISPQGFLLTSLRHWLRTLYFLIEGTHNKSMLTNFQKLLSRNICLKKSQNFIFSKKGGREFKIKKNNRIYEILLPKNIKYHGQIQKLPQYLRSYKISVNNIGLIRAN